MHPFTQRRSLSVGALGEEKLITAIRRWLGTASPRAPFGIGDDCAVLPAARGPELITVDPVIYPRHFDATVPPHAVAAKLLKRNLSDLAAMGGRPRAAVLALTLDPRVNARWLERFYRGLAACARRYRVPVVGGDVAQADGQLAASLTLLGEAAAERVVTRTGARCGDALYVTGRLGGSLASGRHHSFIPRLREGAWLAARPEIRSMMDLSDGLAKDVHALTPRGAEPAIFAADLPRHRHVTVEQALTDGEDYELVFTVTDGAGNTLAADWRRDFPRVPLTRIGQFVRRGRRPAGALDLTTLRGYEHLRNGASAA